MYDEKAKDRTIKYLRAHRETLSFNLPIGTKDLWKDYAASRGMSLTELVTRLIKEDMDKNRWDSKAQ